MPWKRTREDVLHKAAARKIGLTERVLRVSKKPTSMLEDPSASAVALLDDEDGDALDASAYFADPLKERDRPVVFDDHLGLAVETCVGGYTCETLWDALIIS